MIDIVGEVDALVAKVKAQTLDKHEAALVIMAAAQLLQQRFGQVQNEAEEQKSALVLGERAALTGKTVEQQKLEAAVKLKKRIGEPVSATEVLGVAMSTFPAEEPRATVNPDPGQPDLKSTPGAPPKP